MQDYRIGTIEDNRLLIGGASGVIEQVAFPTEDNRLLIFNMDGSHRYIAAPASNDPRIPDLTAADADKILIINDDGDAVEFQLKRGAIDLTWDFDTATSGEVGTGLCRLGEIDNADGTPSGTYDFIFSNTNNQSPASPISGIINKYGVGVVYLVAEGVTGLHWSAFDLLSVSVGATFGTLRLGARIDGMDNPFTGITKVRAYIEPERSRDFMDSTYNIDGNTEQVLALPIDRSFRVRRDAFIDATVVARNAQVRDRLAVGNLGLTLRNAAQPGDVDVRNNIRAYGNQHRIVIPRVTTAVRDSDTSLRHPGQPIINTTTNRHEIYDPPAGNDGSIYSSTYWQARADGEQGETAGAHYTLDGARTVPALPYDMNGRMVIDHSTLNDATRLSFGILDSDGINRTGWVARRFFGTNECLVDIEVRNPLTNALTDVVTFTATAQMADTRLITITLSSDDPAYNVATALSGASSSLTVFLQPLIAGGRGLPGEDAIQAGYLLRFDQKTGGGANSGTFFFEGSNNPSSSSTVKFSNTSHGITGEVARSIQARWASLGGINNPEKAEIRIESTTGAGVVDLTLGAFNARNNYAEFAFSDPSANPATPFSHNEVCRVVVVALYGQMGTTQGAANLPAGNVAIPNGNPSAGTNNQVVVKTGTTTIGGITVNTYGLRDNSPTIPNTYVELADPDNGVVGGVLTKVGTSGGKNTYQVFNFPQGRGSGYVYRNAGIFSSAGQLQLSNWVAGGPLFYNANDRNNRQVSGLFDLFNNGGLVRIYDSVENQFYVFRFMGNASTLAVNIAAVPGHPNPSSSGPAATSDLYLSFFSDPEWNGNRTGDSNLSGNVNILGAGNDLHVQTGNIGANRASGVAPTPSQGNIAMDGYLQYGEFTTVQEADAASGTLVNGRSWQNSQTGEIMARINGETTQMSNCVPYPSGSKMASHLIGLDAGGEPTYVAMSSIGGSTDVEITVAPNASTSSSHPGGRLVVAEGTENNFTFTFTPPIIPDTSGFIQRSQITVGAITQGNAFAFRRTDLTGGVARLDLTIPTGLVTANLLTGTSGQRNVLAQVGSNIQLLDLIGQYVGSNPQTGDVLQITNAGTNAQDRRYGFAPAPTSSGGGSSGSNVTLPAVPGTGTEVKVVNLPAGDNMGMYERLTISITMALNLNSTTDDTLTIVENIDVFHLIESSRTLHMTIAKAQGSGGAAFRIEANSISASSTSFNISVVQTNDSLARFAMTVNLITGRKY